MRKFITVFLLFQSCATSSNKVFFSDYAIYESRFVNKNKTQIISELGTPDKDYQRTITRDFIYDGFEDSDFSQLDYYEFFSKEDIEKSFVINTISWKKGERKIMVWLKNENEVWLCFYSIEFNIKTMF
ncbi:MAG: hypothetical protein Ta2G_12320 [Termitinemataceae bacterium]|nr:MAG: hypothetical protein Ta2G_12320 [Termitinemataceae bacterium]